MQRRGCHGQTEPVTPPATPAANGGSPDRGLRLRASGPRRRSRCRKGIEKTPTITSGDACNDETHIWPDGSADEGPKPTKNFDTDASCAESLAVQLIPCQARGLLLLKLAKLARRAGGGG